MTSCFFNIVFRNVHVIVVNILNDKTANIDLVIKVIDAAKGVGIIKFTIETEKESL